MGSLRVSRKLGGFVHLVTTRIPIDDYRRLKAIADKEQTSIQDLVRKWIQRELPTKEAA